MVDYALLMGLDSNVQFLYSTDRRQQTHTASFARNIVDGHVHFVLLAANATHVSLTVDGLSVGTRALAASVTDCGSTVTDLCVIEVGQSAPGVNVPTAVLYSAVFDDSTALRTHPAGFALDLLDTANNDGTIAQIPGFGALLFTGQSGLRVTRYVSVLLYFKNIYIKSLDN